MLRFAPEALSHPRWFWSFAKTGKAPDLTTPNMVAKGEQAPTFFGAYGEWMQTPPPSWEDVAWLREQWGGPFMLKGVSRLDDAQRAVDAGVTRHFGLEPRRQQPRRDTGHHPPPARRSPMRWAIRSRCCSTAACAGAATPSRRWPWAPAPS